MMRHTEPTVSREGPRTLLTAPVDALSPEPRARPGPLSAPIAFLRRLLLSDYFVLYLTMAYVAVLAPFLPVLLQPQNLSNILSNTWPLLVVAIGQTFVLIIAGIDLSQGSVIALTSVVGAAVMAMSAAPQVLGHTPLWGVMLSESGGLLGGSPWAVPVGILLMLLVGGLIGLFNGLAIARFSMPPFMVTLVSLIFFSAFAIYLTQSNNVRDLPDAYVALGKGDIVSLYLGPQDTPQIPRRQVYSFITYPAVIALTLAVAAHLLLSRTVFGRYVYAIGANRKAAAISGVPTQRVIVLVFMISALFATAASILYSARLEAGRPTLGAGTFLLDIIGATVIGGTSLFGGKGKVIWTVFGVLFFVILSNTLNLMNLSSFHINMVKGAVILLAALADVARRKLLESETRVRAGAS
jgi:ribose/xylose/arabinose/galactoside ABC-type transport system permease subunit